MTARTFTPDEVTVDEQGHKSTRLHLKRACNGCGQLLGDVDDRDVSDDGELTDVRGECKHCAPVVAFEAEGCETWQLTPRSIGSIDRRLDWGGVFTKAFTEVVDGKVTTVGLRVGIRPNHVVAFWGDWIIRHPDGTFTVHAAPTGGEQA